MRAQMIHGPPTRQDGQSPAVVRPPSHQVDGADDAGLQYVAHGGSPIRVASIRPESLTFSMAVDLESAVAVLMSGGLDSAVLAVDLLRDHDRVFPLYIRGGLKWEEMELAAVQEFLAAVPAPGLEVLTVLEEPLRDVYGPHWSTGVARRTRRWHTRRGRLLAGPKRFADGQGLGLVPAQASWCPRPGVPGLQPLSR